MGDARLECSSGEREARGGLDVTGILSGDHGGRSRTNALLAALVIGSGVCCAVGRPTAALALRSAPRASIQLHDTATPSAAPGAPVVTAVTPNEGPVEGADPLGASIESAVGVGEVIAEAVTIDGEHLKGATQVRFGAAEASGFEVVESSSTEIIAYPPAHESGTVDVTVETPAGTSDTGPVDHYTFGPSVTGVEDAEPPSGRSEGPVGGGNDVRITGTNFGTSASTDEVRFGNTVATDVEWKSASELEAKAVQSGSKAEVVDVTVRSPFGRSPSTAADRYAFGPQVSGVTSDEGPVAGGSSTVIEGSGFAPGATQVTIGGTSLTEGVDFTVVSASRIEATTPPAAPAAPGAEHVVVSTPDGTSQQTTSDLFYYGPSVTGLSVHEGPSAGATSVTIHGHGFSPNTAEDEVMFGTARAGDVVFDSSSELEVLSAGSAQPQTVDVTVRTPEGTSEASESDLFSYELPFVEKVEPSGGSTGGGTPIQVLGHGFEGATEVIFVGAGSVKPASAPRPVTREGEQFEDLEVNPPPVAKPGIYKVTVVTERGTSVVTQLGRFTFFKSNEEPELIEVSPREGSLSGGTRVRIRGLRFVPGATEVRFGTVAASSAVVDFPPTEIVATAPPGIGPGPVPLTVSTPFGRTVASPADDYSYVGFGLRADSFEVAACMTTSCSYFGPLEEFFAQAGASPPYLLASFGLTSDEPYPRLDRDYVVPTGVLRELRLDLPPGLSIDPQAVPRCPLATFEQHECPSDTAVGFSRAVALQVAPEVQRATVYNVEPLDGVPAELGFIVAAVKAPVAIEGGLSWHREAVGAANGFATGDYHEYAAIHDIADEGSPLIGDTLTIDAAAQGDGFVTMPSACTESLTYHIEVETYGHEEAPTFSAAGAQPQRAHAFVTSPPGAGVGDCTSVAFDPSVNVTPETDRSDAPDGASVEIDVPPGSGRPAAVPRQISVTLPEGMTVNPAAANGLAACSASQFGVDGEGHLVVGGSGGSEEEGGSATEAPSPPPACPPASRVGTFTVQSPNLPSVVCRQAGKVLEECPDGSEREATPLEGGVYVATPTSQDPESGGEYRLFLNAESARLGVDLRLEGKVSVSSATGRMTATIEMPQLPFDEATLKLDGGNGGLLANPLICSPATSEGTLVPYGEEVGGQVFPAPARPTTAFGVTGCPTPPSLALAQQTSDSPAQAGADSSFTLDVARADGQPYLTAISTTLPAGLVGAFSSVPVLCAEAEADAGTCPAASLVGTAAVTAGAGEDPLALAGEVYLTGPYGGAPYGLSIVVPAEQVGPFDLGSIVTRLRLQVDPFTARATVSGTLPSVVDGVPIRLRSVAVTLNRPGFMRNPTSCSDLATESSFAGTLALPATPTVSQSISTPFRATGCGGLGFAPRLTAATNGRTSRLNGASFQFTLTPRAGDANAKQVTITLPTQLAPRLSTLQQACNERQFASAPLGCPAGSKVGEVTATTPLLPDPLSGPIILVSHGGRAFPDIDLVLEGDGVQIVAVSTTDIEGDATSATFASLPDVPLTRLTATFPSGANALFGPSAALCAGHPRMPVRLVGQNGATVARTVTISVAGCHPSLVVLGHVIRRGVLRLKVRAPRSGSLSVSSRYLRHVTRAVRAGVHTFRIPLDRAGLSGRASRRRIRVEVHYTASGATSASSFSVRL